MCVCVCALASEAHRPSLLAWLVGSVAGTAEHSLDRVLLHILIQIRDCVYEVCHAAPALSVILPPAHASSHKCAAAARTRLCASPCRSGTAS